MNAIVANVTGSRCPHMAVETVKYTLGIAIGMSAVYTIFAIKKRIQLKGSRYELKSNTEIKKERLRPPDHIACAARGCTI